MPSTERLWMQLLAAAFIAIGSLSLRFALDPLLGSMQPFSPGFIAIAITVWWFGWRGAALAAVLIYLGANYFFIEPRSAFSLARPADVTAFITFSTSAGLIIWFGHLARRHLRAAQQANAQKDRFVAMVAHELRGPMGTARNALDLLHVPEATPAMKEGALAIATRQLAAMDVIVRDLLDLGRMNRGQLTLQTRLVDIKTCIDQAVESIRTLPHARHHRITVNAPPAVYLQADEDRLRQILFNLLDNACKHARGATRIAVRVRVADVVEIEVADDGTGIPEGLLPHLFAFERPPVTSVARSDGLGLGLPLTRQLVELHGGTIVAGACPSLGGACITVRMPSNTEVVRPPRVVFGA